MWIVGCILYIYGTLYDDEGSDIEKHMIQLHLIGVLFFMKKSTTTLNSNNCDERFALNVCYFLSSRTARERRENWVVFFAGTCSCFHQKYNNRKPLLSSKHISLQFYGDTCGGTLFKILKIVLHIDYQPQNKSTAFLAKLQHAMAAHVVLKNK